MKNRTLYLLAALGLFCLFKILPALANNSDQNVPTVEADIAKLVKFEVCPPQAELEKILGAKFAVFAPNEVNFVRREITNGNSNYHQINLAIPHKTDQTASLSLIPRRKKKAITERMVRHWFGNKTAVFQNSPIFASLVYQYPWGEVEFLFIHAKPDLLTQITLRWAKSTDCDGLPEFVPAPETTIDEKLKHIDELHSSGERQAALKELYEQVAKGEASIVSLLEHDYREAVRQRLIKWKETESKPEVVTYLKVAPFTEIAETMHQIIDGKRSDFYTEKEFASFPYKLIGEMNEKLSGRCFVQGRDGFFVAIISEDSASTRSFFNSNKIELPFKATASNAATISPLNGPLIDQIATDQAAKIKQRFEESKEQAKAIYLKYNPNRNSPEQKAINAQREALDPSRAILRKTVEDLLEDKK